MAILSLSIADAPRAAAPLDEYSPIIVSLVAEAPSASDSPGDLPGWCASLRFHGLRARAGSFTSRHAVWCDQAVGRGDDIGIRFGTDDDRARTGSTGSETPQRRSPRCPRSVAREAEGSERHSPHDQGEAPSPFRVIDVLLNGSLIATSEASDASTVSISVYAVLFGPHLVDSLPQSVRQSVRPLLLAPFSDVTLRVSGAMLCTTDRSPLHHRPEDREGRWQLACGDAVAFRFR